VLLPERDGSRNKQLTFASCGISCPRIEHRERLQFRPFARRKSRVVKIGFQYEELLFRFWVFLLLPWLIVAPLSGMAFDAGYKFAVYVFVFAIWTYPVSVAMVWKFREKIPLIALLPCVNAAASFISGFAA
jgi:hypothetical protein